MHGEWWGVTRVRTAPRSRHFVYIVRCADGTLYTGWTRDTAARVAVHNTGRGAKYTASRRPVALVYVEACGSLSGALKREWQLKRSRRSDKDQLIHDFSRRRQVRKGTDAAGKKGRRRKPLRFPAS